MADDANGTLRIPHFKTILEVAVIAVTLIGVFMQLSIHSQALELQIQIEHVVTQLGEVQAELSDHEMRIRDSHDRLLQERR